MGLCQPWGLLVSLQVRKAPEALFGWTVCPVIDLNGARGPGLCSVLSLT